ncbi:MAG: type II toxin-antitoxin system YoeB family toxin [Nanoarchaeota archaeon]|nr:type II toxin-antitoxin system YoeB family toxin [Nanoarchaeota archaeon]
MDKIKHVAFITSELKKEFESIKLGKYEDKKLHEFISRAIIDLKENPFCGIVIPKRLIPKNYIKDYGIDNLRKYNLPDAWRLLYSVVGDDVKIVSVLLDWMDHKEYERRFKY